MRRMSWRKYSSTAVSVPIWVIAVKAAPGSPPEGSSGPRIRRWALEEIGRNSVSPWTRPRIVASSHMFALFMTGYLSCKGEEAVL